MKQIAAILFLAAIGAAGTTPVGAAIPGVLDDQQPAQQPAHGLSDPDPMPEPEPEPKAVGGDAEPAPAPPPPPATPTREFREADRPLPRHRVALLPRFAYRLGEAGRTVTPAAGFGLAGTIEIAYLRAAAGLEAAVGIDFAYDRFAADEQGSTPVDGQEIRFGATRVVSETSFILVHTATASVGPVRPYLTIGGGLGLGYFGSAALDLRPGSARDTHLLGRVSLGVDIILNRAAYLALRADYTSVQNVSPFVTEDGRRLAVFGDLFNLGAGVAYRF